MITYNLKCILLANDKHRLNVCLFVCLFVFFFFVFFFCFFFFRSSKSPKNINDNDMDDYHQAKFRLEKGMVPAWVKFSNIFLKTAE